jgi:hypothetical protein
VPNLALTWQETDTSVNCLPKGIHAKRHSRLLYFTLFVGFIIQRRSLIVVLILILIPGRLRSLKQAETHLFRMNLHRIQVEEGGSHALQVLRPLGRVVAEGRVAAVLGREEGGGQITQLLLQLRQASKHAEPPAGKGIIFICLVKIKRTEVENKAKASKHAEPPAGKRII